MTKSSSLRDLKASKSQGLAISVTNPSSVRRAAHYLAPGQWLATAVPTEVTTIVGSCVALCLWDCELGVGGLTHYLLPRAPSSEQRSGRFGDSSFKLLLDRLYELNCRREMLRGIVVGGACMIQAFQQRGDTLGQQNIQIGLRMLRAAHIPLVMHDYGGSRGRKIIFRTDDGNLVVQPI